MLVPENIVTFDSLAGMRVERSCGHVEAAVARPRSLLRATFRCLGMLIGLAPVEFVGDAEQLRVEAIEEVRRRAEDLGANAVIGLQFHVTEGDDESCEVRISGDAVVVVPDAGEPAA